MTNVIYARIEEVATDCYIVVAAIGNGHVRYHNGPEGYEFFDKAQAERLAAKVSEAKVINEAHWNDGSFCDMSIRDMEDEYYNRYA